MDSFFDFGSPNVIALIVSALIFVITVALISFRLINFVITCVLLFFAIASGFAIANNDLVREYFSGYFGETELAPSQTAKTADESRLEAVRAKIQSIFEQLVELLSNHSKTHKDDKEKSQQLKSTILGIMQELDQQRQLLQDLLEQHTDKEPISLAPSQSVTQ